MNCPNCNVALVMSERQGIEIDYCPKCRGVWLDRGELDKIIERSRDNYIHPNTHDYKQNEDYRNHGYKRRKGFLEELFD